MDLYRFYDKDERLLYVGISLHAAQRASNHRMDKAWWSDVTRMDVQHLNVATRPEAEAIERRAITDERPLYNVTHNVVRPPNVQLLAWTCEMCGEPIADGEGYVELPSSETQRYANEKREWEERHGGSPHGRLLDMGALFDLPDEPHWWAVHRACDPEPSGGGYWFDIERIRTYADVLGWTAHLMGKCWFADTDWDQLLRRVRVAG